MNLRWFCYDDEDVGDAIIHTKSLKWRSEQIIGYVEQIATKSVISVLEMDGSEAREVERYEMGERIRSIVEGPEGALWVLEDERNNSGGRLLKLTPTS